MSGRVGLVGDRGADEVKLEQFHRLLLRIESRLADELVVTARTWLADGMLVDIAETIAYAALTSDVVLAAADIELITDTIRDAGGSVAGLADLRCAEVETVPPYRVAPVAPAVLAEEGPRIPYTMDLTAPHLGPGGPDVVDAAAVAAVAELAGVYALWRSWRYPLAPSEWPRAKRAYLVQVADRYEGARLTAIAAVIQERLTDSGETHPLVGVFADDATLPAYHRIALRFAALLWTAQPRPEIYTARDCAAGDSSVTPDLPRLDEPERGRVLAYLAHGTPLLITTEVAADVVDPTRGATVPTNIRCDGEWIWSDAIAYYLDRYQLAPDPPFLAHVRSRRYVPAEVDLVALHRTLAVLHKHIALNLPASSDTGAGVATASSRP